MTSIHEVAPDTFRLMIFEPAFNLQFNHFLVRDEEPVLFHTGYRRMFPALKEELAKLLDPAKLRWIGFSHFESDECGALNQWLELAPQAQPICTFLAAALNVNDFALREAKAMPDEEVLHTGKYRFRFLSTAHLPHGWDAGVLFEETQRTLFCSDIAFHFGEWEPLTQSDILGRVRDSLREMHTTPFSYSVPYTPQTRLILEKLAGVNPKTLATMHGSSFTGDCAKVLRDLDAILKEMMGGSHG
jgi:flavorubredoxin